ELELVVHELLSGREARAAQRDRFREKEDRFQEEMDRLGAEGDRWHEEKDRLAEERDQLAKEVRAWQERVEFMEGTSAWRLRQRLVELKQRLKA
ncbi:MAG TPA: hypothetical protein VG477_11030, partial [Thermoanaerobaculia bacterium]|nr:hypothetical protein [Thermoanaerobaculia bacterium]